MWPISLQNLSGRSFNFCIINNSGVVAYILMMITKPLLGQWNQSEFVFKVLNFAKIGTVIFVLHTDTLISKTYTGR